jgi:predicted thioesterase
MSEKRQIRRIKGRLPVSYDSPAGKGAGYTANYSPGGIQIVARTVYVPGTQLSGKITLPDKTEVPFDGEVRWAKRTTIRGIERDLSTQPQNAMGIKFLIPLGEAYFSFLQKEWEREGPEVSASPTARVAQALRQVKPGLTGRASLIVSIDGQLLSGWTAAQLIERAAEKALEPQLGKDAQTATTQLQMTLSPAPLPKGVELTAEAKLVRISVDDGKLTFEVTISQGADRLGSAEHVRQVV